jgi:hypothetical protein
MSSKQTTQPRLPQEVASVDVPQVSQVRTLFVMAGTYDPPPYVTIAWRR